MTQELNSRNSSGCSPQICSAYAPQTSHIPGTLSEMPAVALMEADKDVEFG